jgi:pyruvate ferredoxin oxidoreductase alpha subunit
VVYIAAAMRAPIVMAMGNRALSGPINIHCDHSDSMLIRDSGVVQLFAENAQEAYDLTVIAPRLAEDARVLLPVLVCQDGFTITHSAEPVAMLDDDQVREFVGDYTVPYPLLDVSRPTTQGPFAMPDYYFELRHQQTEALRAALDAFTEISAEYEDLSGRSYGTLEAYGDEVAARVIVALGSSAGTVKDVVDELREQGERVGLLKIASFRPFPAEAVAAILRGSACAIVLDRSDSPGGTPALLAEVASALAGTGVEVLGHVYGLGGRDLHPEDVREIFAGRAARYVGLRGEPCPA